MLGGDFLNADSSPPAEIISEIIVLQVLVKYIVEDCSAMGKNTWEFVSEGVRALHVSRKGLIPTPAHGGKRSDNVRHLFGAKEEGNVVQRN